MSAWVHPRVELATVEKFPVLQELHLDTVGLTMVAQLAPYDRAYVGIRTVAHLRSLACTTSPLAGAVNKLHQIGR